MPSTLEEQIAQIYGKFQTNGAILVTRVPCQQQEGMVDCGLFSIATAYHRARGDNPGRIRLDQSQRRQHLLRCFVAQALAPFLTLEAGQSITVRTKKHIFIHLYCTCKMPESYDTRMVQCDDCDTWYHFKCVGIRKEPEHYVCPSCLL